MALLIAAAVAAAGCSDDDDAQGSSTTTASSGSSASTTDPTLAATTSAAPTSSATTPSTTDTPTTPEPTTEPVDVEALKAEIARDYERAFYRGWGMLRRPRLRNLDARAAKVLAEGSPAYESYIARTQELVVVGDAVVPNDPDLLSATVEKVDLVGPPPYRRAVVTVCEVTNRKQVTLAENSPSGEQIEVAGSGNLEVIRYHEPVRRTENGWLRFKTPREGIGFDRGETTCPPE
jgi:hypothetical protein